MMSARQAAFRAAYRAQIAPAYSGLIHVALIYLIGGSALWYAAQHIHAATLAEIAVIPRRGDPGEHVRVVPARPGHAPPASAA